jgi:hypothetical protein
MTTAEANIVGMLTRLGRVSTLTKVQPLLGQPVDRKADRDDEGRAAAGLAVLWHWTEMSHSGRFSRRDQIDPWMRGNCSVLCVPFFTA